MSGVLSMTLNCLLNLTSRLTGILKVKYRKIARMLLVSAALMGKIVIGLLLMYAGTFFTVYAFTHTSIDDLRIGVLALKFLGVSFLVISVGMTLVAVQEFIEDSRYI